jgi:hypothetical protein
MSRFKSGWFLLFLVSLGSIAFTIYHRLAAAHPLQPLAFDRPVIDLREEIHTEDGPPLQITAELVNQSSEPVEVVKVSKSCSCMLAETEPTPWVIQPGESRTVRLQIDVKSRSGNQSFELAADCRRPNGEPLDPAQLAIQAYVRKPLTAIPEWYYDPIDEDNPVRPVKHTFVLADDWAGAALPGVRVAAAHPARTRVELRPAGGLANWGAAQLNKRFELDVEYTPSGEKDYEETITVTPDHAGMAPLTVKLIGRWAPAVSVEPAELAVYGTAPGATESRLVEYRYRHARYAGVRCEPPPAGVSVTRVAESASTVQFRVDCVLPSRPGTTDTRVTFTTGEGGKKLSVPIKVILAPPVGP